MPFFFSFYKWGTHTCSTHLISPLRNVPIRGVSCCFWSQIQIGTVANFESQLIDKANWLCDLWFPSLEWAGQRAITKQNCCSHFVLTRNQVRKVACLAFTLQVIETTPVCPCSLSTMTLSACLKIRWEELNSSL